MHIRPVIAKRNLMKFHINIELDIPRWARNAALVIVPVAIVLATTAIVRANVPNAF